MNTHKIKAFVAIVKFGDEAATKELVEYFEENTLWAAFINDAGNVVLPMRADEIGAFMAEAVNDPKLNWIQYTVQFEV